MVHFTDKFSKRMLVIDDEEPILHCVKIAMEKAGFDVDTTTSGAEGIKMFDAGMYDVVLTDIQMPDIDGHQIARHVRESGRPSVRMLGLTGKPYKSDFDAIYMKPISLNKLAISIREMEDAAV